MIPNAEAIAARAAEAVGDVGAVVLTSDGAVKRLNARYRGRNKPTNVLTFESGDVVLAAGVVRREARAAGRPVRHVLSHLIVHGALHLRGHDHGGAGEARRMEQQETRILHSLGVPNPWRRA
jgi:probable rRNA maturation factor